MNTPLPRIYSYSSPARVGVYPVTVAEMGIHLRLDSDVLTAETAYLESLIKAATQTAEDWTKRTYVVSDFTAYLDGFLQCLVYARYPANVSGAAYTVRRSPLISMDSIQYFKTDATVLSTIDAADYRVTVSKDYSEVYPVSQWPTDVDNRLQAILFSFQAGYPDDETEATVTNLVSSGTTATATAANHQFTTGQIVTVAGATPNEYNGAKTITVTDANTFTYTVVSGLTSPATGTITATHGESTVPWDIKEAIMQHVASMWTKRGDCSQDMVGTRGTAIASGSLPMYSKNIYTLNRIRDIYVGL